MVKGFWEGLGFLLRHPIIFNFFIIFSGSSCECNASKKGERGGCEEEAEKYK